MTLMFKMLFFHQLSVELLRGLTWQDITKSCPYWYLYHTDI